MWLDVEMWLPLVLVGFTAAIFFSVASQLHSNP